MSEDWTNQEIKEAISVEDLRKEFEDLKGQSTINSKVLLTII
jgi:hypothetical protein